MIVGAFIFATTIVFRGIPASSLEEVVEYGQPALGGFEDGVFVEGAHRRRPVPGVDVLNSPLLERESDPSPGFGSRLAISSRMSSMW